MLPISVAAARNRDDLMQVTRLGFIRIQQTELLYWQTTGVRRTAILSVITANVWRRCFSEDSHAIAPPQWSQASCD